MEEITPRFEFRAFASGFGLVAERIRAGGPCGEITESHETYLVARSPATWDRNVKVRDDRIEIKELLERRDGLERWRPGAVAGFPLPYDFLRDALEPALGLPRLAIDRPPGSLEKFVSRVVLPHPACAAAWVAKRRFRFKVGGCPTEIDELTVNGAALQSVAAESEDAGALRDVVRSLGLDAYENVNYPRAIRRILGIESSPGQPWHEAGSSGSPEPLLPS